MKTYEIELTTPLEETKVVIKTMLTGEDDEAIENAQLKYAKSENFKDFTAKESDLAKISNAKKDELLARSIVSINGDATNCLQRIKKLPAKDYRFVHKNIVDEQKKMMG